MIVLFPFLAVSLVANVILIKVLTSISPNEIDVDVLKMENNNLRNANSTLQLMNSSLARSVEDYAACNDKLELQFKQKFCCHPPRFVNWSQAPHEIRCGLCNVRVEIRAKTDEQAV